MIDHRQLNALEQRTSRLLRELRTARAQNASLEEETRRLRAQLEETQRELDLLRENTQVLTTTQQANELLRDRSDKLREKLRHLLRSVSALRAGLED